MSFLDLQDESSAAEMKKKTKEMKVRVVKVIHITYSHVLICDKILVSTTPPESLNFRLILSTRAFYP